MEVRLRLLGTPRLEADGVGSELPLDRPAALGYYLAQRGDWVRRSELAYLYSPEADEAAAFANLRKLVYRLRQQGWAGVLEAEATRLRLCIPTDVQAFRAALERRDWAGALELYGGPFLQGLAFPDLSGYEAWLELERQDLARAWRSALMEQVRLLETQADWLGAERWLSKLLAADPLDEEAVQAQIRVLRAAGRLAQAQEVFERFRRSLKLELGVEPLESTRALADGLDSQNPAAAHPRHNLPAASTRFIGRSRELRALNRQLANPDCRLLTVVGLGGMGKTRLALELASQQTQRFDDGVWLVALAGVASPEQLVSSIASALGFTFAGSTDPKTQLLNYLRGKTLLLLLDNFEHLLEGAPLLEELLTQAPGLKLLVTSRAALELPGEWLFDLEGLGYPPPQTEEDLDGFDAVRLFIARAERLSSSFVITPATLEAIAELTRRVQGMPLAIELLSTWVRGLGVGEILAQLGHSFGLLQTSQRDLPERHRSLRAILEYTWQLLTEAEQAVLAKLSVFRGGFTLEAAQSVAGAHLGLLLRFINQALLRRGEDGRYDLHELVRQFAAERLDELGKAEETLEGYLDYFQGFAQEALRNLNGEHQIRWLSKLKTEHTNLINALDEGFVKLPDKAVALLAYLGPYWHLFGLYAEGERRLRSSLDKLSVLQVRLQAIILIEYLRILFGIGRYKETQGLRSRILGLCRSAGDLRLEAELYNQLGWAATSQRQFEQARVCFDKALSIAEQLSDSRLKVSVTLNLARMAGFQNQPDQALAYQQKALAEARAILDTVAQLRCLTAMGWATLVKGDYIQSVEFSQQALELALFVGSKSYLAIVQGNLGFAKWQMGEREGGEQVYRQHLILHLEQGAMEYFFENAFELARFWSELGYSDDAVRLWGYAEGIRSEFQFVKFPGYEEIKAKVLGTIVSKEIEELLKQTKHPSLQEILHFLKVVARGQPKSAGKLQ
ncbi:MAG: transcriptional activator [Meiothermus sp.]|uniref:ATP-binding protein n=1 Tax=Meiothermus sp. TaxID=1955249 RepID=UPI0021DECFFF|nr:BTAD domain-containing putative transcriptional regulator [Meiothermus sp.]GIW26768.1 MAG: transcriptional activator [Meiothermus sp.]